MPTTLLRPHFLTIKNRFLFRRRYQLGSNREFLMIAIAAIIAISIFYAFTLGFRGIRLNLLLAEIAPAKIIELTFHYFFFLLIISNTVSATGNIYTAANMNLLLAAPVSSIRLYTAKFFETAIETGIMYFLFITPATFAYYLSFDLPARFLINALVLSLLFLPIPVGIGIVIATITSRIVALIWRRGAFFLSLVFIFSAYALFDVILRAKTIRLENRGGVALADLVDLFKNPSPVWAPGRWVAEILNSFLGHPTQAIALKGGLLGLSTIASFFVGFLVFDLFALRVRSASATQHRLHSSAQSNRKSHDLVRKLFELVYRWAPYDSQVKAVILKDLSSLIRDRAQSLQLVLYLGIATIYVTVFHLMSESFTLADTGMQLWYATLTSMHFLFTGFLLTTITTRLVYPSMSLEGQAVWILQVTPIEISLLVRAKVLCWLPITTFMTASLLLVGALAIGLSPTVYPTIIVLALALGYGYTGLAIGLGCSFATFDWESPNQISVGTGALTLLLLGITLIFLLVTPAAVLIFLAAVPALREVLGLPLSFVLMSLCLALIVFINLSIAKISCKRGARALERARGNIV
jgi:hypothetical protein